MIFAFTDYELDESRYELRCLGVKVPVQPKVLDVLFLVVRNRDRVVLKRELLQTVWPDVAVSEASIARAVMEARKAIGDDLQQMLVTVRGRGLRFAASVDERGTSQPVGDAPSKLESSVDASFVGRETCIAALDARLDDARGGHGSLVWVFGEAGVGKTRTLEELTRRARRNGATVLGARAHEDANAPPFWLWAQVLRGYAEAHLEPATKDFMRRAAAVTAGTPPPSNAERFALFDAVTRHLVGASRRRPHVIALDDVHWADDASIELLRFMAQELRDSGLLILAAYRDTTLSKPLGRMLAEHARLAIPLRGLARADIPRFVEAATGSSPTAQLADALFERSGGNPLYLHELLKTDWAEQALSQAAVNLASSMDLRQGLIESICRHVETVSEETRELLAQCAVLGPEIDLAKLVVVSEIAQDRLLDRLDEAIRQRILRKAKDGRFKFAHGLVREVLYKKLSGSERASRHRIIAERLLAHYDASDLHAAELAHHFVRALPGGDPKRAVALSMTAAEREVSLGAHAQAVKLWEQARRALTLVRGQSEDRIRVELGLGRALALTGQDAPAREAFLDAAILARTFSLAEPLAEAALGFALVVDPSARARSTTLLEEADAALEKATGRAAERLRSDVGAALATTK